MDDIDVLLLTKLDKLEDKLEDKLNDFYIEIRARMNEQLFPRGREEVMERLDALINGMTFIGLEAGPVDWWSRIEGG